MTRATILGGSKPRTRSVILAGVGTFAVVLLANLATGLFGETEGVAGEAPTFEMPPMPVDVAEARQESVADVVRATGRVEAIDAIELKPDAQGRIVRLLFREGQAVAQGAPLVRIDDAMLRAQAERARADRDLATQQLERVRRLSAENASAPADLERAEAAARSADAALALLELQIERTTVRAPFSGVVGQRHVSVGDYVTPSVPLLTLHTVDPHHAVFEVPERHATALEPGQSVEFTVAAQPDRVFTADVEFIDPAVHDQNRTILVKARARNSDRVLRPGMFIEARLATGTRPGAVLVPEDAVQPLRTGNIVWAVVNGRASRRVVQLGARARGLVEVVSGVEAGEQVVVGGLERMAEGAPLMARSLPPGDEVVADTDEDMADTAVPGSP